jgi:hypothetical protein
VRRLVGHLARLELDSGPGLVDLPPELDVAALNEWLRRENVKAQREERRREMEAELFMCDLEDAGACRWNGEGWDWVSDDATRRVHR